MIRQRLFFEHITQYVFPNMSATPNIPKKDRSTDRFCFLYDYMTVSLAVTRSRLNRTIHSAKQQNKFSIILRAVHQVQKRLRLSAFQK